MFVRKQNYETEVRHENVEMVVYSALSFLVPFLIGHPQIVVGILVNIALVMAALNIKGEKLLPVMIMPSLGVLSRGLVFGSFTMFLVYMIPFIWLGNGILILVFKKLYWNKKINRWITLIGGAMLKAGFLFGVAFVLVSLKILPSLFLTTMGIFQLYTALIGGFIALSFQKIRKLFKEKEVI